MIRITAGRMTAGLALAAMMSLGAMAPAQAQERALRRATSGEPAMLNKAMTQSQARRACQREMRGSKEGRAAIRTKMTFCVNEKMQGN
jgi:hypothetical protein